MKVASPLGKLGEDIATDYLKKHGYKIIDRNFSDRYGEIDIVALESSSTGDTLVFVEVKARKSLAFGTPLEAITYFKMQALIKTAQYYKLRHPKLPELMRIDAVTIIFSSHDEVKEVVHIKDISS